MNLCMLMTVPAHQLQIVAGPMKARIHQNQCWRINAAVSCPALTRDQGRNHQGLPRLPCGAQPNSQGGNVTIIHGIRGYQHTLYRTLQDLAVTDTRLHDSAASHGPASQHPSAWVPRAASRSARSEARCRQKGVLQETHLAARRG